MVKPSRGLIGALCVVAIMLIAVACMTYNAENTKNSIQDFAGTYKIDDRQYIVVDNDVDIDNVKLINLLDNSEEVKEYSPQIEEKNTLSFIDKHSTCQGTLIYRDHQYLYIDDKGIEKHIEKVSDAVIEIN